MRTRPYRGLDTWGTIRPHPPARAGASGLSTPTRHRSAEAGPPVGRAARAGTGREGPSHTSIPPGPIGALSAGGPDPHGAGRGSLRLPEAPAAAPPAGQRPATPRTRAPPAARVPAPQRKHGAAGAGSGVAIGLAPHAHFLSASEPFEGTTAPLSPDTSPGGTSDSGTPALGVAETSTTSASAKSERSFNAAVASCFES
jgi:hypothetical protein